ncbi:hypothetical protein BXZ70DRAFT_734076 [Cristinia sonorae]|uniref:Uncharacterized protein n=1 Tax=Cristinia sonorae TaxID=1940300 RepID=A0A8K0XSV2_9AGAR|nr:hypothetical protein BXZ70DRAFT_734076 [Cristinia sonorae]
MPARPRTPSPGPDEPKYLTVVSPYPLHANMELLGDLKQTVYWIASCIGPDPLFAVFHKPSAPNMIIIEVARSFDKWETLLGEHKWADFLRLPTHEERDKVSQIFYCKFSTGREVQKHGWLRKDVESAWFQSWTPKNRIIKQPYPSTSYCPTPSEDMTNAPLCRPLPVKSFPPPPPPRMPPVGSPEWLRMKEKTRKETPPATQPKSAWAKGPPNRASAPGSANGWLTPELGGVRPATVRNIPAASGPVLPPGINTATPLAIANSNSTSPSSLENDWSNVPPPLSRGGSNSSSGSGSGSIVATPLSTGEGSSIAGGTVEDFARAVASVTLDDETYDVGEDVADDPWDAVSAADAAPMDEEVATQDDQTIWAGYTFKDPGDANTDKDKEPPIECIEHGKLCKRGICKQYKAQKRERERAKEAAERRAEMEQKVAAKNKKKKEGTTTKYKMLPTRPTPPHIVPPTNNVADSGWGQQPAGAASSRQNGSSAATKDAPADSPARPARGRRMNTVAAAAGSPSDATPPATAPVSDDGWGHISVGPWGSGNGTRVGGAKKPPSSVASSGWGNPSEGPWGSGDAAAPPGMARRKPPSSVASSNGWGNISNGPWGPGPGGAKKKGPSSVVSAASSAGWGNVSDGPWAGSRAPSVRHDPDDDDSDDAKTVDGRDEEEKEAVRGRPAWGSSGNGKKSWAEQVEDEDNRSVTSSNSGWGRISNGPW